MTRRGWRTRAGRAAVSGLALGLAVAVAAVAWGRPGVVTTKDGATFEGDVTVSGGAVVIKPANGQPITMNKGNVADIRYTAAAGTPAGAGAGAAGSSEQFKQKMAKLGKNDVAGRIALARQAHREGHYEDALDALDAATAIDPNNVEAIQLKRTVMKQREIERRSKGGSGKGRSQDLIAPNPDDEAMPPDDDAAERPAGRRGDRATTRRAGKLRTVTPEEINRIRQLELADNERVQVRFENDVKRKFQASSEFTPQEFAQLSPQEQAMQILKNGSRKMREDVTIATDPQALALFKSLVQRNALTGCASSSCHGTRDRAGDFYMLNPAGKDAEAYTNFILLQDYKTNIEDKEFLMIDRARPANSLLLLYGLPPDSSDLPHPKVMNFRPMFKGKTDPKYQQTMDWLGKSLAAVAPDYGIDLTKEAGDERGSTTRPARPRRAPREEPAP